MTDHNYELWISRVLNTDPPEFVLYAVPPSDKTVAFTSPLLSKAQALSALVSSTREGLGIYLELVKIGNDQQIGIDFRSAELVTMGLKPVKPQKP